MIGRCQPDIACSPPSALIVEEPGRCIRWNVFMTSAGTPQASRSPASTARTTPSVASGRKAGSGRSPCGSRSMCPTSLAGITGLLHLVLCPHTFHFPWLAPTGPCLCTRDNDSVLAARRRFVEESDQLREPAAIHPLEQLSEIVGHRRLAVAVDGQCIGQERLEPVGALIIDQRMGRIPVHREEAPPRTGLAWREAAEGKGMHRQSREHQRCYKGRRPRNRRDGYLSGERSAHEREARVRDARGPGIGYQCHRFALGHQPQDAAHRLFFIVLVEGKLWLLDLILLQKQTGLAGILAGDDVHTT